MQGNGRGRNEFFEFGGPFPRYGGFDANRNVVNSSFFGGRDPFDDPFFTRPHGGGFMESNVFGPGGIPFAGGMFDSNFFGPTGNAFVGMHRPSGFLRHEAPNPQSSRGPVIEELNSDDEKEGDADKEIRGNARKHSRTNEPLVEVPDDDAKDKRSKHLQYRVGNNRLNRMQSQPQTRSFSFQSSTMTYGGVNGAYHTSSRTRRTGSDGVTFEESKEANSASGQATHMLSRGLHNKGHSVTRKLNSGGNVETMQTLHNIDQDELSSFEEAWKVNAPRNLPGWNENFIGHGSSGSSSGLNIQANRGGWALPSTQLPRGVPNNPPDSQYLNRMSGNSFGRSANAQGRTHGRRT